MKGKPRRSKKGGSCNAYKGVRTKSQMAAKKKAMKRSKKY